MTREEAIDRVRQLYLDANDENKAALEALIPDLKDSEDERIRKEIRTLYNEIDSCIDELLKARTDKDTEAEGKALFKMEGLMVATLQDLSCIEDYLEKRKEQKHKTNPLFEECVAKCDPEIMKEVSDNVDKILEQKPELPPMKGDADLYFDEWKKHYQGSPTKRKCFEEGMRYAQRLQKPAEWSEEDEKFINKLCDLLAAIAKNGYVGGYYVPDLVNRLKSLRPQPHWEPSEEQPEVDLEKEIDDWYNSMGIPATADALKETASHFYELGKNAK